MTQALLNDLNNFNTLQEPCITDKGVLQAVSQSADSCDKFTKIYDSKIKTVGDVLQTPLQNCDIVEKSETFKEIVVEALEEANMLSSLNLTLTDEVKPILDKESFGVASEDLQEPCFSEMVTLLKPAEEFKKEENEENEQENQEKICCIENFGTPEAFKNKKNEKKIINVENSSVESCATVKPINDTSTFDGTKSTGGQTIEIVENNNVMAAKTDSLTKQNMNDDKNSFVEEQFDEKMLAELNIEKIEVESSAENSYDGSDLMQNQTPQEQGVKAMLNVSDMNFEQKANSAFENQAQVQTSMKTIASSNNERIIEQVAKQMENLISGSKVNIILNPESLGKVSIQLINTNDGLSAQFTVATQEAKDALMQSLNDLKANLLAQGVSVDDVSVKLNEPEESSYNQDWTEQEGFGAGAGGQGQHARKEKEKGLFEKMMAQVTDENDKV